MATNYELLDQDALIQPAERPFLAALDFGITFGVVWALFTGIMTVLGMNHLVRSFIQFLEVFYPGFGTPLAWDDLLLSLTYGFAHGFLFGLLIAYIYNRWRAPYPCGVKLKRPGRITAETQPVIISDGEAGGNGGPPYTIAIIANPVLESAILSDDDDLKWRRDPILDFPKLFQAKVACIISSLASSPIIVQDTRKNDNLLDKMRIMTLFDPELGKGDPPDSKNALCLEADYDIVIEPIQRTYKESNGSFEVDKERLIEFLEKHFRDRDDNPITVDAVFAVTASETHTRSSALYTIDRSNPKGPVFKFDDDMGNIWDRNHDLFPKVPGLIALSAWDNRIKTPLHEFAHAMSSTVNGIIHDEYYDDLPEPPDGKPQDISLNEILPGLLVINKRHLPPDSDLPQLFGIYTFPLQDKKKEHKFQPDKIIVKPPDFEAFAPVRLNPRIDCTMDISGDENRFDRMIEQFMKDRLEAKMNR